MKYEPIYTRVKNDVKMEKSEGSTLYFHRFQTLEIFILGRKTLKTVMFHKMSILGQKTFENIFFIKNLEFGKFKSHEFDKWINKQTLILHDCW